MKVHYRKGETLIYQNRLYEFISKNSDGSLLVRPQGSLAMISIPDSPEVQKAKKTIYSGRLFG